MSLLSPASWLLSPSYSFLSYCSVVLFPGCLSEGIREGFGQLKILFQRMSIAPASKKLKITLLTADALCIWKHLVIMFVPAYVLPKIQII